MSSLWPRGERGCAQDPARDLLACAHALAPKHTPPHRQWSGSATRCCCRCCMPPLARARAAPSRRTCASADASICADTAAAARDAAAPASRKPQVVSVNPRRPCRLHGRVRCSHLCGALSRRTISASSARRFVAASADTSAATTYAIIIKRMTRRCIDEIH